VIEILVTVSVGLCLVQLGYHQRQQLLLLSFTDNSPTSATLLHRLIADYENVIEKGDPFSRWPTLREAGDKRK
jgi:hypothetical protein